MYVEKLSYREVSDIFNITKAVVGNLVKAHKEGNSKVNKLGVKQLNQSAKLKATVKSVDKMINRKQHIWNT